MQPAAEPAPELSPESSSHVFQNTLQPALIHLKNKVESATGKKILLPANLFNTRSGTYVCVCIYVCMYVMHYTIL